MICAMVFSRSSYGLILGANDRVNVGVVGFSDRFRTSLLPSFESSAQELNFDMIAVSDIWNRRRREGTSIIDEKIGHSVKAFVNNDELYNITDLVEVMIAHADFPHDYHTVHTIVNKYDVY